MQITIKTIDGIEHKPIEVIDGQPDLSKYSPNTRNALQKAYVAGSYEIYTAPVPLDVSEPNNRGFLLALMPNKAFRGWQKLLPNVEREDLKFAANAYNWELTQLIYNDLKAAFPPDAISITEWQTIANQNNIPLVF